MPGKKPTHTGRDATKEATGIKHEISIHAPHTGRDSVDRAPSFGTSTFQSTRPIRGATKSTLPRGRGRPHFNPRAPYGARPVLSSRSYSYSVFQSTRPIRGATDSCSRCRLSISISIRAPHTGRDQRTHLRSSRQPYFNPRAPYGARPGAGTAPDPVLAISIHAPHTGRDDTRLRSSSTSLVFQSTRPIRGATNRHSNILSKHNDFNPRAPYGARLAGYSEGYASGVISIHAPHTGRDEGNLSDHTTLLIFQSTRPIRGATRPPPWRLGPWPDFNPRAPYGARRRRYPRSGRACEFQSTRPIRGATAKMHNLCSAFLQQQTIKA